MSNHYYEILNNIASYHGVFLAQVTPPEKITYKDSYVYRFSEKSLNQAIVQKLARLVTGLRAQLVLHENGLYQEQQSMQRIINDTTEDVEFLSFSMIYSDPTIHHTQFLAAFYAEKTININSSEEASKVHRVERQKIRAYLERISTSQIGGKSLLDKTKKIYEFHSEFLHAHSAPIMDMYFGTPPHFHLGSMSGTHLQPIYMSQLWSSFYNGVLAFGYAAEVFKNNIIFDNCLEIAKKLEVYGGKNYSKSELN